MDADTIRAKYLALAPELTERARRLWAATEALAFGRGGVSLVQRATGISRVTITTGIKELQSGEVLEIGRARRPGGWRN